MLDPAQLFNQALTALGRGNRPLARDRLERILAARPSDCEAALMLAQILRDDGDTARAEAVLVAAIKAAERGVPATEAAASEGDAEPVDTLEVYLELADLRLALGRPADAARACRRVLASHPKSWEALYLLGNAFLDASAPAEAQKAYREALATNPFEAEIWWNLGVACERAGDAAGAAEAYASHARMESSPERS